MTIAEALKARRATPRRSSASGTTASRGRRTASILCTRWTRGSTSSSGSPTPCTPGRSSPRALGRPRAKPVSGYADDLFTDRAVDFLKRHRDGPFFLYLPYIATHFHIEAPADEVERTPGQVPRGRPREAAQRDLRGDGHPARQERRPGPRRARRARAGRRTPWSSSPATTARPSSRATRGRATPTTATGRSEARSGPSGKAASGSRAGALAGPHPRGVVCDGGRPHDRLFPTLLAAAGAAPDPAWKVDGLNVLPVWTGKGDGPERTLFWEWRSEGCDQLAAMRGDLKLVVTHGGKPELFDVVTDPAERRDVAAEHPGTEPATACRSEGVAGNRGSAPGGGIGQKVTDGK